MKNTIKLKRNFIFDGDNTVVMPAFVVKYRPKNMETGEYGLIVTKKTFPLAVCRNRARRLVREWLRLVGQPADIDLLFIIRASIIKTDFKDGVGQMKKALQRIRGNVAASSC